MKAVFFAGVDVTNPDEVKAAIAIFGYVWTGINVLQVNMQEFSDSEPFDYDPSSPVDGGHSVITRGYGVPGAGGSAVTSGSSRGRRRPVSPTPTGRTTSRRHSSSSGLSTSAARSSWRASTKHSWPQTSRRSRAGRYQFLHLPRSPLRPPAAIAAAPVPDPQNVLEELAALARSVAASAEKDITELLAFLASHNL